MNLEKRLLNETGCEVKFDPTTRTIYSVDASIYEVKPCGIAIPKTEEDLQGCIQIACEEGVSITARGAATGITGGCLGEGLIIDTSKYLNKISHFNWEKKQIRCQPGVIQDDLNAFLLPYGLRLGPDTSTGNRATLGGMVANGAAGSRSLHFGTMYDAVEAVELVLSTAETLVLGPTSDLEWEKKENLPTQEGKIYQTLGYLKKKKDLIQNHFPKIPRRVSGYALDRLLKDPCNLSELIVGSEGTLGVIQSITLKLVNVPNYSELYLIPFDSMQEAMEAVHDLLALAPAALEMVDDIILEAGKNSPAFKGKMPWLQKVPPVLVIAEFLEEKSLNIKFLKKIVDKNEIQSVWNLRKAGLGLLLSKRTYSRAIAFIEDVSIPPENLPLFMNRFLNLLEKENKKAGIYGHIGHGCLHIRPYMDLRSPSEIVLLKKILLEVTDLVKECGGALSGEHGDGLIRSWLNERFFGKEIVSCFEKVKQTFDPKLLMNPHKIVHPLSVETHIRIAATEATSSLLSFQKEGGLTLTADLCNGNGACRKKEGVMCPSFQVTHDEYDSTRARAQVFRHVLKTSGDLADPELHKILDLCIQCKGCKTECPSQVDMAKMKAEALFHYQEKHGYTLRNTLFAHLDTLSSLFYPLRHLYNPLMQSALGQKLLLSIGIVGKMPPLLQRFSSLAKHIKQPAGNKVILLSDTYTEFYNPHIGLAAISVLNKLGFNVQIAPWACCGRPALSKGFLKKAKKQALHFAESLIPYGKHPILSLEPSCFFTLFDEFPEFPKPDNFFLFDTFLTMQSIPFPVKGKVAIHGHCHQKALLGMQGPVQFLRSLPGLCVEEIPSGCCGMAGSFGHEKEHAAFSQQIGELTLLPYVRGLPSDTCVIANGYSCRSQIQLHTQQKAYHLAEWLNLMDLSF